LQPYPPVGPEGERGGGWDPKLTTQSLGCKGFDRDATDNSPASQESCLRLLPRGGAPTRDPGGDHGNSGGHGHSHGIAKFFKKDTQKTKKKLMNLPFPCDFPLDRGSIVHVQKKCVNSCLYLQVCVFMYLQILSPPRESFAPPLCEAMSSTFLSLTDGYLFAFCVAHCDLADCQSTQSSSGFNDL